MRAVNVFANVRPRPHARPPGRKRHQFVIRRLTSAVWPAMFLFLAICTWQLAVRLFRVPPYLVPSPTDVAAAISSSFEPLLSDLSVTAIESVSGFAIGGLLGFIIGILLSQCQIVEKAIYPYFIGMQAVPIVALAPLLVVWFGSGTLGKIIMASFICIFPVVVNTVTGLNRVGRDSVEMMEVLSASKWQILLKLRIPNALPFVFAGLRVSSSLSVIGAIVAEIAGARSGLGHRIIVSSYRTDMAMMFAAIIIAACFGVAFFGVVCAIERSISWDASENANG